jgi:hypothetical protein
MRSNTAYLALFFIAALVAGLTYGVISSLLPWENEGNVLAYGFFLLTAALAALTGTGLAWILRSILYGLATAGGAVAGLMFMAGRRTARRTRL